MAITYTTWNPDDRSANITLSGDNLIATTTADGWDSVRSVLGVSSGKWYWEITISDITNKGGDIGIGDSGVGLSVRIGTDVDGYCYEGLNGTKVNNGSYVAYGDSFTDADIISVALDMDAGKLWWAKNGVWQASGNPGAGTDEAYSGITGTFYAMIGMYYLNDYVTANFGAAAFSYSVPSGFNSGFYTGSLETFTFTDPTPTHLSTVFGTTEQICLTTTISGEAADYVYDAAFYDESDVQIGTTVFGINSGSQAASNANLSTPSGIDYSWYMTATSSGGEDTSSTYTFHNRFLYEGYVTENNSPISRKVNLYYRNTGELVDTTTSSGSNGYYKLSAVNNDTHFIVTFDDEAGEDYNALILDKLLPVGSE